MLKKQLYTESEIAVAYALKESYLRKLRQLQAGPVYVKLGRMIRYKPADVEKWLDIVTIEVQPKRAS